MGLLETLAFQSLKYSRRGFQNPLEQKGIVELGSRTITLKVLKHIDTDEEIPGPPSIRSHASNEPISMRSATHRKHPRGISAIAYPGMKSSNARAQDRVPGPPIVAEADPITIIPDASMLIQDTSENVRASNS